MNEVPFVFVIDTDAYAGNFEREICAYVTGHWDGETHGGDQAEVFKKEVGDPEELFGEYITTAPSDDSYPRQVHADLMWEPQGKGMNSVGIFFEEEPTAVLITLMKDRAIKFAKEGRIFDRPVTMKIIGFRLLKRTVKIDEVAI